MYNATVTDHFVNPRNSGVLKDADVVGRCGLPGRGNYLVLYLKITAGRVHQARFQTYGCPAAIASGSWVAEWIVGRTLEELTALEVRDVVAGLGGIPLGKEHCPPLAVRALRDAVEQLRKEEVEENDERDH